MEALSPTKWWIDPSSWLVLSSGSGLGETATSTFGLASVILVSNDAPLNDPENGISDLM